MLKTKIDLTGSDNYLRALDALGKGISEKVLGEALFKAAKPMEEAMKANAPVGPFRPSSDPEYRRGGATRDDVRRKIVYDVVNTASVLIGVSKSRGGVGWRAHFIEQGTKKWAGHPFIERSGKQTENMVVSTFEREINQKIDEEARKAGL